MTVAASLPAGGASASSPVTIQTSSAAAADYVISPQGAPVSPTAAEREDLTVIAQDEAISINAAIARYSWQGVFGDAVQRVREAYPGRFAGSGMNEDGAVGGVVRFTENPPRTLSAIFEDMPVPVTVVTGQEMTEAERSAAVSGAHYAARAANPGQEVSTEFAGDAGGGGEVVVTVYDDEDEAGAEPDPTQENRTRRAASKAVDRGFAAKGDPRRAPDVRVVVSRRSTGAGEDTIRGGAILTLPGSTRLVCTSGWAVRSTSGGNGGLVTADHCPSGMNYSNRNVLTDRRDLPPSYGDIKFLSSTEDVGNTYYYGVGNYRVVTGKGNPSVNQRLCKFGRTTGLTCDEVRDLTTCRNSYCNLVSMDHREAGGGDSGGHGDMAERPTECTPAITPPSSGSVTSGLRYTTRWAIWTCNSGPAVSGMHLPLGRLSMVPFLLTVTLLATACSDNDPRDVGSVPGSNSEEETVSSAGGVVNLDNGARLIVGEAADSGGDVAVEGSVAVQDSCVGLRLGNRVYTAVFPDGTTAAVEADRVVVQLADGTATREGELFTGSGSFGAADSLPGDPQVPAECRPEEVVVLNP